MRAAVMFACAIAPLMAAAGTETMQQHVHSASHEVMPFDVGKTLHVFRMTETGGTQRVVIREPAYSSEVGLIRGHLKEEASRFQAGNFSDPAHLHGAAMPGLKELEAGAARIRVTYRELPDGAEIEFETRDPALVTAVHRWFGAQLSEHGADARAE
jgi:hypothetical protein